jgi:L-amino acid N-acyltransferase YncA
MKKGKKFIGTFVNEMYAILLGIGIGNVLFAQNLDLGNIFEVVMILFVIGVILVYWWDWTEYVSENVISSKIEFVVDFLILIALELLFSFFNNPYFLIRVFIGLGVLNLLWVINYNIHTRAFGNKRSLWWMLEKVIVIVIYVVVFILITYVLPKNANYISAGLIIISFVIARFIGFSQLRGSHSFKIRKAKPDDASAIVSLNNKWYTEGSNNKGFLVTLLDEKQVAKDIESDTVTYFIAESKKKELQGFVSVSDSPEEGIMDSVTWIDKKLEEKFKKVNNKYIEKVAVVEGAEKKGLGRALYQRLFQEYPKYILYSFAAYYPKINEASINFHTRMGFKKSGIFERDEFLGIKDYRSIFFTHYK